MKAKISDFSKARLKELNSLTHDEVKSLSKEDFIKYYQKSVDLGNQYMINGKKVGPPQPPEPPYFASSKASLKKNEKGEWEIWQPYVMPDFEVYPLMVSKERFEKEMLKQGVPPKLLKEFFEFKPTYD